MTMFAHFFRLWPSALAVVLTTAVSVYFRWVAVGLCGGQFIYPIDDTYIHIALAKNIVGHGVWGVEPGIRAFCSSSPLWTIALAALYSCVGVTEALPWYLAHAFNIASLIVFDLLLLHLQVRGWLRLAFLLALAVSGPFFCTTALGMEHSMHAFFLLATLIAVAWEGQWSGHRLCLVCVLAFSATASRYESLFFLLPFFLGVGCTRRDVQLAYPVLFSILPVVVYGVWAVLAGGMFLPNSLMLKGQFLSCLGVFSKAIGLFANIPLLCEYLYALVCALLVVLFLPGVRAFWRVAIGAVIVAVFGHLVFAQVIRQLCRYEAYLVTIGVVTLLGAVVTASPKGRLSGLLRLMVPGFLMALLGARAGLEVPYVTAASEDIYSQQVQMTRIMAAIPESGRGRVAINDIGYFSLHSGLPILDIWGLGTQEVAAETSRLRRLGKPVTSDELTSFANRFDVRYGVLFEKWYPEKRRPVDFKPVGYLLLYGNRICGADIVTFCARREEDVGPFREHLKSFIHALPPRARLDL